MAISDDIKEQTTKLKDMTLEEKIKYIWDYYKIVIIIAVCVIIGAFFLIRDVRENSKPTQLYAVFINSNFAFDGSNTLESDYIRCMNVDINKEHVYFSYDINFTPDYFDTTALAYQQKLVSMYKAKELDAVIGPVLIMETSADSGAYGNLEELLPQDLLDELSEKGYEFYYYKGRRYSEEELSYMDEDEKAYIDNFEPYMAGIYLDNCSYLNNMGEYGAYDTAQTEDDRPIFTIPYNTQRLDNTIEFLRFLTEE